MMKIRVLTSSRADYGIYLPLLKKLHSNPYFDLSLIVFGTHMSRYHGYTIDQIKRDGFKIEEEVDSLILGDTREAISNAIGNTVTKFSSIYARIVNNVDVLFALGDRYEMFAAVSAAVPFNIKIAHIHGGETTLGAIDNMFRHAITMMSTYHFTSTQQYANKVAQLIGSNNNVYNVGALSLDNIQDLKLLSIEEFLENFKININKPTILATFHPETVSVDKNIEYAETLCQAFEILSERYQIIITMPNADTMGSIIRARFNNLAEQNENIIGIENFGTLGYFSCIRHCVFLLGNTSSGIIEAASFHKYVINLGDRQKGRAASDNLLNVQIKLDSILEKVQIIEKHQNQYNGRNIYYLANASQSIIHVLNTI